MQNLKNLGEESINDSRNYEPNNDSQHIGNLADYLSYKSDSKGRHIV